MTQAGNISNVFQISCLLNASVKNKEKNTRNLKKNYLSKCDCQNTRQKLFVHQLLRDNSLCIKIVFFPSFERQSTNLTERNIDGLRVVKCL